MSRSRFADVISRGCLLTVEYESEGSGAYDDGIIIYVGKSWSDEYGDAVIPDDEAEEIAADICANFEFDDWPDYE